MHAADDPRRGLLDLYRPAGPLYERGEGAWLIAEDGSCHLDFTTGIAVNALGHGSPLVRRAIEEALETGLIHTSNLFRTRPAEELALQLLELTFPGKVFFNNSGAEANEAALKFARRWARARGGASKHEFIAFRGSFHGRLFGTVALTDRAKYREPFEPLMPGVRWAEPENLDSVRAVLDRERTAGIVVEPIQGEGGVTPMSAEFLQGLRALADEAEVALIFDEVQCGFGRSGTLFAYEPSGVTPDILTLAKPIAGGLPMGAVVVTDAIAETLQPGDHGTTFGGGPFVASVARAVLCALSEPALLEGVRRREAHVRAALAPVVERHARVQKVRGRGLMLGLVLNEPCAAEVVAQARAEELLLVAAGTDVIRLLPPLNVEEELLDEAARRLDAALGALS